MSDRALTVVREAAPAVMMSVTDVRAMAEAAAQSGLFPAIKTPQAAFALMMLCQAEGLHPMQALRRFDIVQGRVAMKADAMLGEFQQRGGRVKWLANDTDKCAGAFSAPGIEDSITVTWTMEDAKRAGLAGKPGPWQQYPRQMLRARVISEGIRMAMPAVVVGLYAPEEVQDFVPAPKAALAVEPPPPAAEPVPAVPMASPAQVKALNAAMTGLGIKDREEKLAWISDRIGRVVASSKDLTSDEAHTCISAAAAGEVSPEPGSDG